LKSYTWNPGIIEGVDGRNTRIGLNYDETNRILAIHHIVNIWKTKILSHVTVNIVYSAYYLNQNKVVQESMEVTTRDLVKSKLNCDLGLNHGLTRACLLPRIVLPQH